MIKWIFLTLIFFLPISISGQENNINQTDRQGRKTGEWIGLYENGKKKYHGFFVDGHPVDTLTRYYENGVIKAVMIHDSTGNSVLAILNDEEGNTRAVGNYLNRKKNGNWKYFTKDGIPILEISFSNDHLSGVSKRFYANGQPMEKTTWENDTLNGLQQVYSEEGYLSGEFFYRKGKLDGAYHLYYQDGSLSVKGRYSDNLKEGNWEYYLADGSVDYKIEYLKGQPVNEDILDQRQKEEFEKYEKNKSLLKDPRMYLSDPESYFRR